MSDYFPIRPKGEGSEEIESLPSFFARAARHHSISLIQFAKHLGDWWKHSRIGEVALPTGYLHTRGSPLCGFGPNVDDYLKVLTEAMGVRDLGRTTLCGLRPAAARYGQKTVKGSRAWCPACMHERLLNGEHYDSLLWMILPLTRCHIHRLRLVTLCPSCQSLQIPMHRRGLIHLCWRCERSLLPHWRAWSVQFEPSFGERDCVELVQAISDGSFSEAAPDALQVFCLTLRDLMAGVYKTTTSVPPRTERVRVLGRESRPTLITMLRQAELSGVSLLRILSEPRDAAKVAGEFECMRRELPPQCRPRQPKEVAVLAEQEISKALKEDCVESLRTLAKRIGVSTGYLRYRFPALCQQHIDHWMACRAKAVERKHQRVVELLRSELLPLYASRHIKSQDELVDRLVQRLGVGKRTARLAVYAATSSKGRSQGWSD